MNTISTLSKPAFSLTYYQATYAIAPVYGQHVRQPIASLLDQHPMLPEQIELARPLNPNTPAIIHTTAKGRTSHHGCLFWVEWQPSRLPNVYYAFYPTKDITYLLVFIQPRRGHLQPFHLLVIPVDESFPPVSTLWDMIADIRVSLPPLDSTDDSL